MRNIIQNRGNVLAQPSSINFDNQPIGQNQPSYLIAEISANHNQSYAQAEKLIHAAKESGADAVKLQTYTADTITIDCDSKPFQIHGTLWGGRTLYDLYQEAHTPWEWQPRLKRVADSLNITFFSTPFDNTSVQFLEDLGIPGYKVASFEIIDIPLLECIGKTKKPVILSTGMASLSEIKEAIATLKKSGCTELALLRCTSAYPAPLDEMNLRSIPHLHETFGLPVGLSDHSLGITAPIVAVALGACIIEKHLTLSRKAGGPDAAFSLEPDEFRAMVTAVREAEKSLGRVSYQPSTHEMESRIYRRSLFVVEDIQAGQRLTKENVRSIRPGDGMAPKRLQEVLGKRAKCHIKKGTPLDWKLIK